MIQLKFQTLFLLKKKSQISFASFVIGTLMLEP